MILDNFTLVTCCWGDYWDKYGESWIESVRNLTTKPSEIIVSVDHDVVLPDGWKQMRATEPYFFDAWMKPYEAASNEYVGFLSMDDKLLPTALDNLTLEGEVVVCGLIHTDGVVSIPQKFRYDNIFKEETFPLVGWPILHKNVFSKVQWRPVMWQDWIAALEYRYLNLDVRFDSTVRYVYSVHPRQYSRSNPQEGFEAVDLMKQLLPTGRVVHDNSWPPRLK